MGGFLHRAVAENPERRYMTAETMLQDLESLAIQLAAEPSSRGLYNLLSPLRMA
jgi:hypothetical protein